MAKLVVSVFLITGLVWASVVKGEELPEPIVRCLAELKQVRDKMTACLDKIVPKRPQLQSNDKSFIECHDKIVKLNGDLEIKIKECEDTIHSPNNTDSQDAEVQRIFQSWGRL